MTYANPSPDWSSYPENVAPHSGHENARSIGSVSSTSKVPGQRRHSWLVGFIVLIFYYAANSIKTTVLWAYDPLSQGLRSRILERFPHRKTGKTPKSVFSHQLITHGACIVRENTFLARFNHQRVVRCERLYLFLVKLNNQA